MSVQEFDSLIAEIASSIAGHPVDSALEAFLNQEFGAGTSVIGKMGELCAEGERDGWLLQREAAGIKYGRAVKPNTKAGPFSVDVVRMKDVVGPHHIHTNGEIGAIMPMGGSPKFDGKPAGWYVYPPGSDHCPTVTGGDAYILYLLPQGAIEFTGR